ncbi:MAG: substrate-binding domain-containing protein [Spirochaetales bacterium]|nr:substrate-binding domain-containing protein [Spirochaetales bacterium]
MTGTESPTIGVFTAELNDSYQEKIWEGIVEAADRRGIGLISFLGSRIKSPIPQEISSNTVYAMAHRDTVDGLIIISSAISSYVNYDEVVQLFAQRKDLPQVSIGLEIPGIPSVTVDGRQGMADVIEHLICEHHRSRFALITGPHGHGESEERIRSIFQVLDRHDITLPKRRIKTGSFEKESGITAARDLLLSGTDFDALVCLNDKMAIGAWEVLSGAGIDVPNDVSLVGFDGQEEAESLPLLLTTVRQPLAELGAAAVEQVLGLIHQRSVVNRTLVCTPVFGETCGCRARLMKDKEELREFSRTMGSFEKEIYHYLKPHVVSLDTQDFLAALSRLIHQYGNDTGSYQRFHSVLSLLHQQESQDSSRHAPSRFHEQADLLLKGFSLIARAHIRGQTVRNFAMRERFAIARSVGVSISEAFEVPVILKNLSEGFSRLKIADAYLVLYTRTEPSFSSGQLFYIGSTSKKGLTDGEITFPVRTILPETSRQVLKNGRWALLPLVFQAEALGYLILPARAADSVIYDAISKQIASTLKGTALLDQVRSHEKNLEGEVSRRTRELTRTNQKLTEEIKRRIRLEEEVIDISNKTMNRIGQDLHDDLCQHLAGISMIATALKKSLQNNPSAAATAEQINALAVDSIDRTKSIVRGLVPPGLEEHGLGVAVDALVEAAHRSSGISVSFIEEPGFPAPSAEQSLQLYRIIQEGISNALRHSNCTRIEVKMYSRPAKGHEKHVESIIEVSDNGSGIPAGIQPMGMGLKIMKYRAEKANAVFSIASPHNGNGTMIQCRIKQET